MTPEQKLKELSIADLIALESYAESKKRILDGLGAALDPSRKHFTRILMETNKQIGERIDSIFTQQEEKEK